MTREERKKFENLNSSYNKYWVPCVWFSNLAAQARREGRIRDNSALKLLLEVGPPGGHSCKIPGKLHLPGIVSDGGLPRASHEAESQHPYQAAPRCTLISRGPTPRRIVPPTPDVHSPLNTLPGGPEAHAHIPPGNHSPPSQGPTPNPHV